MMPATAKQDTIVTDDHNPLPVDLPYDPVKLAEIMQRVIEQAQPVIQKIMQRYNEPSAMEDVDPLNIQQSYHNFVQAWIQNPDKLVEKQMEYWNRWTALLQEQGKRAIGQSAEILYSPAKGDKRFNSEGWDDNGYFDFIKQSYLMTTQWMQDFVRDTEGLPDLDKQKLAFYMRQYADAMAPTNFVITNPDVLKETMETGGENLMRGFKNLLADLQRGDGALKISMTDYKAFTLGDNIAATKGSVVYQNHLLQLIQYEPTTDKVFKTPLLIVPPCINKYYILDLSRKNSFIQWLVDQGHTVFCVSWVNPSPAQAHLSFHDYVSDGVLRAIEATLKISGEKETNMIAYCIGGTMTSMALSYLAEKKQDSKVASVTYLTTLLDFEKSGELKLFTDEETLERLDKAMERSGVLQGSHLQRTFSMLRANDLIWSFVINNYMLGREPFPFDLLYWNDDATNMPATFHKQYLRWMYQENKLVQKNALSVHDQGVDLSKIKTPSYFLSTKEDHIAPWKATFEGHKHMSGPVTFTLAASGHIAGVVNPPAKNKYCFWTSDALTDDPDDWFAQTTETQGSWWPHWQNWVEPFAGTKVKGREIDKDCHIEPAPGSYVRVKI